MAANTATLLPDFPISIGNRRLSVITLTGMNPYVFVTSGSPPTGGQALLASQFGLKYLDSVFCDLDNTGVYTAIWTPTSSTPNGVIAGILMWFTANAGGGGEPGSVDLSAKTIRVTAIGR
jgi:hypothetical protein